VIDLNQRLAELGVFSHEPIEQMRARIVREKLKLEHELDQEKKDKENAHNIELSETDHRRRVFWAIFVAVLVVGVIAVWIGFFDSSSTPEAQAWARTTASAIVGGLVGYFTGAGLAPR
jgi:hypothetical protein